MMASGRGDRMRTLNWHTTMLKSLYWLLRIFMGTFLLASAVGKALDVQGFVEVVRTYEMGLSLGSRWAAAIATIGIEAGLGLWILSGRNISASALASLALNAGYFVFLASTLMRGVHVPNCGCFGVFLPRPLGPDTLVEDLILCVFSWGLYALAKRKRWEQ